ncbi:MAG: hypothetical protein M0P12_01205 [Paludibacteraceae bacterium]|nr:hypothetical protein [Paludibacteraceae bacterium]MCK9615535.1 hypothetical protein [Candidatus Omnitrophota bacterium]
MNFYDLKAKFLTIFGDIKVYKYPPFMVYCPVTYKAKGKQTREAIGVLEPGDIILRGYSDYLDSLFIPGKYSHTGLYVGDGKMIHAVAEGVSEIDVIDFLRCDIFCILRPSGRQEQAIERAYKYLGTPYDFNFETWNNKMYCHEFGARCYYGLNIDKKIPKLLFGILKGKPAFLAESFLESLDFKVIYQFPEETSEK